MRRYVWAALASMALAVAGCSSVRKLSRVESREPASARKAVAISSLRAALSAFEDFAPACPEELRDLLPELAGERVNFPACPARLRMDYEEANPVLNLEERGAIDGILSGQCRSLVREPNEQPLEILLENFETSRRPVRLGGVRGEREISSVDDHSEVLKRLKSELEEVRNVHLPLDQWVRRYGEFVLAEDELEFLNNLVVKQHCKMENQEIDQSYRTIRSLEELAKLEREDDPQRARIERFLLGVHKVIDRRLKEFFSR